MTYPTNMSITNYNRPTMKQDKHPDHNMPAPEHDGQQLPIDSGTILGKDQTRYGDNGGADLPRYREDNEYDYKNKR